MRRGRFTPLVDRLLTVLAVVATATAATAVFATYAAKGELPALPEEHRPTVVHEWRSYAQTKRLAGDTYPTTTIVIFSDYLCRYCAYASDQLKALKQAFPNILRVVWRHYPLLGPVAQDAAAAAVCAEQSGHFESVHRVLFEGTDSLGRVPWTRLAAKAGVADLTGFDACLTEAETREAVDLDAQAAKQLGIGGTPGVLLDSLLFHGIPETRYLRAYIRLAIRRAGRPAGQ